jgi:hypothetical protein
VDHQVVRRIPRIHAIHGHSAVRCGRTGQGIRSAVTFGASDGYSAGRGDEEVAQGRRGHVA